jgi:hypothetical protein
MATTIQIVVAGLLLLAWTWVLGRPPIPRGDTSDDLEPDDGDGASPSTSDAVSAMGESAGIDLPASDPHRIQAAISQRRRQRLLATMFATFASFFLAVAFRGTFVHLFVLMSVALVVHLGIASHVGGRLVAEQRAVRVAATKRAIQVRARARSQDGPVDAGPVPGADRGGQTGTGATSRTSAAGGDRPTTGRTRGGGPAPASEQGSAERETSRPDRVETADPFGLAAEMASALESGDEAPARSPQDLVSELIDAAWAEPEPELPAEEPEKAEKPGEPAAGQQDGAVVEPGEQHPSGGDRPEQDDDSSSEAIFTRPAREKRSRFRRKRAEPIHIESQLDGDFPTAVNHR